MKYFSKNQIISEIKIIFFLFFYLAATTFFLFYLVPRPIFLEEKGCNNKLIRKIAPLLQERGWGEGNRNRKVVIS